MAWAGMAVQRGWRYNGSGGIPRVSNAGERYNVELELNMVSHNYEYIRLHEKAGSYPGLRTPVYITTKWATPDYPNQVIFSLFSEQERNHPKAEYPLDDHPIDRQ